MGSLNSWDVTDANNNLAPPDGWPENTMAYSDVNNTGRAVQGTIKRFFSDNNGSLVGAGVVNAYTVTLNETAYIAYFTGMTLACSIPITNTIAAPTLNVNGIGAVTIVDNTGAALPIGALQAGGVYDFFYDGASMRVSGGIGSGAGGATTQIQYNSGGLLAGMSEFTFDGSQIDITYTGSDYAIKMDPVGASARAIDISITNISGGLDVVRIANEVGSVNFNTGASLLQLRNLEPLARGACLHIVQDGNAAGAIGTNAILIESATDFGFAGNYQILLNQSGDGGCLGIVDLSTGTSTPANVFTGNNAARTEPIVQIVGNTNTPALEVTGQSYIDFTAADLQIGEFSETAVSYTAATGTKNLDVSEATSFYAAGALTGNTITFSFDNPPPTGRQATITIELNDGGGATAINWPASVDWPGGTAPTLSNGIDIISFTTRDGGTTWLGFVGGLDFL